MDCFSQDYIVTIAFVSKQSAESVCGLCAPRENLLVLLFPPPHPYTYLWIVLLKYQSQYKKFDP